MQEENQGQETEIAVHYQYNSLFLGVGRYEKFLGESGDGYINNNLPGMEEGK